MRRFALAAVAVCALLWAAPAMAGGCYSGGYGGGFGGFRSYPSFGFRGRGHHVHRFHDHGRGHRVRKFRRHRHHDHRHGGIHIGGRRFSFGFHF